MVLIVCAITIPITILGVLIILEMRAPQKTESRVQEYRMSGGSPVESTSAQIRQKLLDESRKTSAKTASKIALGAMATIEESLNEKRSEERAVTTESAVQVFVNNLTKEFPEITEDQVTQVSAYVREAEQKRQAVQDQWAKRSPAEWDVPAYNKEIAAVDKDLDKKIEGIFPREWHAEYQTWRLLGGEHLQYESP